MEKADDILELFKQLDEDRDGTLDKDEFAFVFQYLGGSFSQRELEAMIEAADVNRDGRIGMQEFIKWIFTFDDQDDQEHVHSSPKPADVEASKPAGGEAANQAKNAAEQTKEAEERLKAMAALAEAAHERDARGAEAAKSSSATAADSRAQQATTIGAHQADEDAHAGRNPQDQVVLVASNPQEAGEGSEPALDESGAGQTSKNTSSTDPSQAHPYSSAVTAQQLPRQHQLDAPHSQQPNLGQNEQPHIHPSSSVGTMQQLPSQGQIDAHRLQQPNEGQDGAQTSAHSEKVKRRPLSAMQLYHQVTGTKDAGKEPQISQAPTRFGQIPRVRVPPKPHSPILKKRQVTKPSSHLTTFSRPLVDPGVLSDELAKARQVHTAGDHRGACEVLKNALDVATKDLNQVPKAKHGQMVSALKSVRDQLIEYAEFLELVGSG